MLICLRAQLYQLKPRALKSCPLIRVHLYNSIVRSIKSVFCIWVKMMQWRGENKNLEKFEKKNVFMFCRNIAPSNGMCVLWSNAMETDLIYTFFVVVKFPKIGSFFQVRFFVKFFFYFLLIRCVSSDAAASSIHAPSIIATTTSPASTAKTASVS